MPNYRYILYVGDASKVIEPTDVNGLALQYEADTDNRFSYKQKISKGIVLVGADFKFLYQHEISNRRCQWLELEIQRQCSGVYGTYQRCRIALSACKFDLDRCTATIELQAKTAYDCYEDNKKTEVNLFEKITTLHKAYILVGELEFIEYSGAVGRDFYRPGAFPEPSPAEKGWTLYEYTRDGPIYTYKYAREKATVDCSEDIDTSGWYILADTCSGGIGTKTLARPAMLFGKEMKGFDTVTRPPRDLTTADDFPGTLFVSKIMGHEHEYIDNGFVLADVVGWFAQQYCTKPVKSNILGISPDGPFEDIYPDFPLKTLNALLFQKSDVKRPDDYSNATKALVTWEKLINALCKTFNLKYIINEEYFVLEHVSYFGRKIGLDTTATKYRDVFQSRRYEYLQDKLPQFEHFEMMEAGYPDFVGKPIEYKGACATGGEKTTYPTEIFTTDVQWCLDNGVRDESGRDSGKVRDEGFVLMACDFVAGEYVMKREPPILDSRQRANNSFSWAHLQRDYWKWDRPQKNGYMNNELTLFKSTMPIKKGEVIRIPFGCGETIKLTDLVGTFLGPAIIGSATYNMHTCILEIEPLYTADTAVFICHGPATFTFNRRDGNVFYFDTTFFEAGSYTTEVQWKGAGGEWNTVAAVVETGGETSVTIPGASGGTYYFRKRTVCGEERSEWTDEVEVITPPTVCEGVPAVAYVSYDTGLKTFKFRLPAAGSENPVNVEILRPDGIIINVDQGFGYLAEPWEYFSVSAVKIPFAPPPAHGAYKFRFRWKCSETLFGEYSAQLTVTI